MLVVCRKEGLLSNRLFHFSHLISFAIKNDEMIWYPYIEEFRPLFANLRPEILKQKKIYINSGFVYEYILKIISWTLRRFPKCKNMCSCDDSMEFDLTQIKKNSNSNRLLFLSGWLLRDYESVKINHEMIRSLFAFGDDVISDCDRKLLLPKENNSIVVGVHIRRGDYKFFQDGKYFYEVDVYEAVISQLKILLTTELRSISFMVCTNDQEIIKSKIFKDPKVFLSNGSQISDLCMLSKCDYVIGPPSTFSAWASFYGSVPIVHIHEKDQTISMFDFKVIEG